jgi:hypothetical protein
MTEPRNQSAPSADTHPLLLHPAAEKALAAVGKVADELAKLNAAMDKLVAAKGESVRPAVEALAEQLIGFLDATMPDPDLEDDDEGENSDEEPSLGAPETVNQERAWRHQDHDDREWEDPEGDELDTLEASDLDISGEADGHNGGCVDDEPSLGSLDSRISQKRWGEADRSGWWFTDAEQDDADPERGGIDTDELERDDAEQGIADVDGLAEQACEYVRGWHVE